MRILPYEIPALPDPDAFCLLDWDSARVGIQKETDSDALPCGLAVGFEKRNLCSKKSDPDSAFSLLAVVP